MDSLLEELDKHLTPTAVSQLAEAIGSDPQRTTSAIAAALPMIVGGLSRNTLKDPQGAQALNDALRKDHDGGLLDSLDAMFGGASHASGLRGNRLGGNHDGGGAGGILGGILGSVLGGAGRGGNVARSSPATGGNGGLGGAVDSVLGSLGRDTRGSTQPSAAGDASVNTGPSMQTPGRSQSPSASTGQTPSAGSLIDLLQGKDGAGILGHIFGQQRATVQSGVGKASGLDMAQVGKLMALLAPIVMGALGRMNRSRNLGASGLTQVLDQDRKSIEHAMPNATEGSLLDLLDTNRDGKVDASEAAAKLGSVLGMFRA